jgi:hypothetical protein
LLPHPFSVERRATQVVQGQTIDEIMAAVGCKPGRADFVLLVQMPAIYHGSAIRTCRTSRDNASNVSRARRISVGGA